MTKIKDGFYKQIDALVGSNDYVLLAGGGVEKLNTKTITLTLSASASPGWYRIALTNTDIGNNVGTFLIVAYKSGYHTVFTVNTSISFGKNPNISILQCSLFTNTAITEVRLVYSSSYSGKKAYLEVKLSSPTSLTINITKHGFGWTLLETAVFDEEKLSDGLSQILLELLNKTIYSENLKAISTTTTKLLYVEGGYGSYQDGMKDDRNAIIYTNQFTKNSYHPILKATTFSGNIVNIGGIVDNFGIYGYLSGRTTNGVDWSININSTNGDIYPLRLGSSISTAQSLGTEDYRWECLYSKQGNFTEDVYAANFHGALIGTINVKKSNTDGIFPLVFTNRNTEEKLETLYTDTNLGSGYNPNTDSLYTQGYYIKDPNASIPSYRVIRDAGAVWIQGGVYDGSTNIGKLHISGMYANNLDSLTIHGKILPSADHAFNFGSPTDRWLNTYSLKFIATNSVVTPLVTYDGILTINSNSAVYIKYNNTDNNSVVLGDKYFKPFGAANGLLDLGLSNARWKTIYGQSGNLSSTLLVGGETTLKGALKLQNSSNSYVNFYNNNPTTPQLTGGIHLVSGYNTTTSYYNSGTNFYFRLYSPESGDTASNMSTTGYTDYILGSCVRGLSNERLVYNIWHSGNDGHGSGLDADTIDGKQLSSLGVWCGSVNTDPTETQTKSTTTTELIERIHAVSNLFDYNFSAMRGGWYFNGNTDYDTGWGTFSMAGTAVLNMSVNKNTTDTGKSLLFIDSLGDMYSYVSNGNSNDNALWSRYFKQGNTSITIGNKFIKLNETTGPTNLLLPSFQTGDGDEGVFVTIPKDQYTVKVVALGRVRFNGSYLSETIGEMFSHATISSVYGSSNSGDYVWITTVKFAVGRRPSSNHYIITGTVIDDHDSTPDGIGVYIFNKTQNGFKFTCPTLKIKDSSSNIITKSGTLVEFTILEYVLIR